MFRRRALMDLDALRERLRNYSHAVCAQRPWDMAHADLQTLELTSSDLRPQRFRYSQSDSRSGSEGRDALHT